LSAAPGKLLDLMMQAIGGLDAELCEDLRLRAGQDIP
jgi:hypothetical protein